MVYADSTNHEQVPILTKIKVKIGKRLAKSSISNSFRKFGLRLCGFEVGEKVYIGESLIVASIISEKSCKLVIKNRVAIGPRVTLLLSSDANWSKLMEKIPYVKSSIYLEKDCWIGAGAIIMPGITVGERAIVGAGAVVTKNVLADTIVSGVPAKKMTNRYINETE